MANVNSKGAGQLGRVDAQINQIVKSGQAYGVSQADIGAGILSAITGQMGEAGSNGAISLDQFAVFESAQTYQVPMTGGQFSNSFSGANGPLTQASASPNTGLLAASSDFAASQTFSCPVCLTGIGIQFEPESEIFTIPGAIVPDNYTGAIPDDLITTDTATEGDAEGLELAVANWGGYTRKLATSLADAYNFQFFLARYYSLVDQPLSSIASCCTSQRGRSAGFSSSEIDVPYYEALINEGYHNLGLLSGKKFRAIQARRDGGYEDTSPTYRSLFHPDRLSGDIQKVSYDAGNSHPIYSNAQALMFERAVLIQAGVPIQMNLSPRDSVMLDRARQAATPNFGGQAADDTGLFRSGETSAFTEWNAHASTPAAVDVVQPLATHVLKGGLFRVKICFYGIALVDAAVAAALNACAANHSNLITAVAQ